MQNDKYQEFCSLSDTDQKVDSSEWKGHKRKKIRRIKSLTNHIESRPQETGSKAAPQQSKDGPDKEPTIGRRWEEVADAFHSQKRLVVVVVHSNAGVDAKGGVSMLHCWTSFPPKHNAQSQSAF